MYKIGIVGAGHLGKIHLKILQKAPFVNLVGFFDNDPKVREEINALADSVKGFLAVEMSAGQMIEDVRLAVNGKVQAEHYGRFGGVIHSPEEVLEALEQKIIGG